MGEWSKTRQSTRYKRSRYSNNNQQHSSRLPKLVLMNSGTRNRQPAHIHSTDKYYMYSKSLRIHIVHLTFRCVQGLAFSIYITKLRFRSRNRCARWLVVPLKHISQVLLVPQPGSLLVGVISPHRIWPPVSFLVNISVDQHLTGGWFRRRLRRMVGWRGVFDEASLDLPGRSDFAGWWHSYWLPLLMWCVLGVVKGNVIFQRSRVKCPGLQKKAIWQTVMKKA